MIEVFVYNPCFGIGGVADRGPRERSGRGRGNGAARREHDMPAGPGDKRGVGLRDRIYMDASHGQLHYGERDKGGLRTVSDGSQ